MSLNDTPSGERLHIGFFGRRNAGKSSVVNAVTGQDLAVVSSKKGTTTDPVSKAMELLPIGPVMMIDTPGYDDEGELGTLRVRKTRQILNRTDLAVLVVDVCVGLAPEDRELIDLFAEKKIPYLIVYNKKDLLTEASIVNVKNNLTFTIVPPADAHGRIRNLAASGGMRPAQSKRHKVVYYKMQNSPESENVRDAENGTCICVSALTGEGIYELKETMARLGAAGKEERFLVSDMIRRGDLILLVIPIDASAPKGRLILPQQQVIRDILESDAAAICVKENELPAMLAKLGTPPALVITDSQVFARVDQDVPKEIPLTSFSILMARYKGFLSLALTGAKAIDRLADGDRILIAEGCTHHRQCEDIGTYKIPNWLRQRTGKNFKFETCSGRDFPEDLSPYKLIIHCGGCMLNEREVRYRMKCALDQGVPVTNYGIAIAFMKGILERSIAPPGLLQKNNVKENNNTSST